MHLVVFDRPLNGDETVFVISGFDDEPFIFCLYVSKPTLLKSLLKRLRNWDYEFSISAAG